MLLAGDELGRTQHGNNNAYCQDNEVAWLDWSETPAKKALLRFTRSLIALRRREPVLRRRRFLRGLFVRDSSALKDLAWLRPDGAEMTGADWDRPGRALGFLLAGDGIPDLDDDGQPIVGDSLLVLVNAERTATRFRIPSSDWGGPWAAVIDTAAPEIEEGSRPPLGAGTELVLEPLSILAFRAHPPRT
jgi:glycogen operon protein